MPDPLHDLSEHLLRAGLSPSRVQRYVRELADHRDDLVEDLEAHGRTPAAASAEAQRRLGSFEVLALPMLTDRRFRSRAGRWPAIFYLALPLASQVGFAFLGLLLLILSASTPLRIAVADLGNILAITWLAAPVLIGWLTLLAARRRRAGLLWPAISALAGAAFATALQLNVTLPQSGMVGEIAVGFTVPAMLPLILLLVVTALPFLFPSYRDLIR